MNSLKTALLLEFFKFPFLCLLRSKFCVVSERIWLIFQGMLYCNKLDSCIVKCSCLQFADSWKYRRAISCLQVAINWNWYMPIILFTIAERINSYMGILFWKNLRCGHCEISRLTTPLTIYRLGLRGNSVNKSTRKHRFRTEKHQKCPKIT